ncbi:MAG TPA: RusA family crossover junction endodeoxyribonuclease [Pyrinomonadaceae bacterium]|jgi:Holliday junction resolvase RusA-like endonuclease
MAKRALKLSVRIPNYMSDGRAWRRAINAAIVKVQKQGTVKYAGTDKLEVEIRFYLRNPKLTKLDLDNRLKDVLDALQGMIGEKGKSGELKAIIPNDNQVYRLIAEKRLAPKANREALSTILIRSYDHHGGTARSPRDTRKNVQ